MHITHLKKFVAGWLLVITSMLLIAVPVLAAEQVLRTLELVRTYQSKEELQAAYPEKFPKRNIIVEEKEYLQFVNTATGTVHKQVEKEEFALTEAEKQQLSVPDNVIPLVKDYTAYTLTANNMFLIQTEFTYTIHSLSDAMNSTEVKVNQNILYDAQGNIVTNLPPEVFDIMLSPDQQHFIAYGLGQGREDYESTEFYWLYFYSIDGTLINKINVGGKYEKITYSKNGQFIGLFHMTSRTIGIMTITGDIIYEGNYTELLQDKMANIYRLCISNDGQSMLLNTDHKIHLCTISRGLVWERPFSLLNDCGFIRSKGVVAVKAAHDVLIYTLEDGTFLDRITNISTIHVMNEQFIFTKGGKYYEYEIH